MARGAFAGFLKDYCKITLLVDGWGGEGLGWCGGGCWGDVESKMDEVRMRCDATLLTV